MPVTGVSAQSNPCGIATPAPLARSLDDVLHTLSDESIGSKRGLGQRRGHSAHDIDATRRRRLAVAAQHLSMKKGRRQENACRGIGGHSNGHGSVKPPSSVTGRTRFPMACSTRCATASSLHSGIACVTQDAHHTRRCQGRREIKRPVAGVTLLNVHHPNCPCLMRFDLNGDIG